MCGIAGYIGPKFIDDKTIYSCLNTMNNRGPDNASFYKGKFGKNNIYLLHTRLSIIDLNKKSNQPLKNKNGVLIYNGEIYNYKELINTINNYSDKSILNSDTLFLHNFLSNSKNLKSDLNKLDGMWAFAFFNKNLNKFILSRDRFGEKPLYILKRFNEIYFSSEIKQIFALQNTKEKINFDTINNYLVYGYKSLFKKNETFFHNIKRVTPGTYLTINKNLNINENNFWNLSKIQQSNKINFNINLKNLKKTFIETVESRLISDVPICFSLSGGIDSNAIVSVAKKELGINPETFSIINSDARYDEEKMIDLSVNHLKIKNNKVKLRKKNFLNNLKDLINYHDKPLSTISFYLQSQLYKEVRKKNFKVILNGVAADEIFTGYYDHHLAFLSVIKKKKELFSTEKKYWSNNIKPYVRNPFLNNFNYFIDNKNSRDHIYLNSEIFSKFIKNFNIKKFTEKKLSNDLLRNRMMNELLYETTPTILDEDDLNSMQYSIENRSPFLAKNLVEKIYKIPSSYLIKNGFTKFLLRKIIEDYLPNDLVYSHKKVGFNTSLLDLINFNDSKTMKFLLSESPVFEIINKDKIKNLLNKKFLKNSESKFMFNFINTKIFLENH